MTRKRLSPGELQERLRLVMHDKEDGEAFCEIVPILAMAKSLGFLAEVVALMAGTQGLEFAPQDLYELRLR